MKLDRRRLQIRLMTKGELIEGKYKATYPYPNMETLFGCPHKVASFGHTPEEAETKLVSALERIITNQLEQKRNKK